MQALVPVALARVHGLERIEAGARLKIPRIPSAWMYSVLRSARAHLPKEAMYQFTYSSGAGMGWAGRMPAQATTPGRAEYDNIGDAVVDLHSHAEMAPFFSDTDDADERGLRFYVVIGKINADAPEIAVRVGVYGYTWNVPALTVFDGLGPFVEVDPEVEGVLAEAEFENAKSVE